MPKKHSPSIDLPALHSADQEAHDDIAQRVRTVRAIQQQYAAPIIAAGVFNNDDDRWTGLVGGLAEQQAVTSYTALTAWFQRLEKASPNSTRIPFPIFDFPKNDDFAADVLIAHASSWGDAGFLVGLAVGMQLGPHAFDGAMTPKATRKKGGRG